MHRALSISFVSLDSLKRSLQEMTSGENVSERIGSALKMRELHQQQDRDDPRCEINDDQIPDHLKERLSFDDGGELAMTIGDDHEMPDELLRMDGQSPQKDDDCEVMLLWSKNLVCSLVEKGCQKIVPWFSFLKPLKNLWELSIGNSTCVGSHNWSQISCDTFLDI